MVAHPLAFDRGWSIAAAVAGAALLAAPATAPAQSWKPQQPVEIIIGSAAGSSPDTMARAIQQIWQETRLVEVAANVVNRPNIWQPGAQNAASRCVVRASA